MRPINKYEFYMDLGYNENQSLVLSKFTFGNSNIREVIEKFNRQKDSRSIDKNISFCDHLMKYIKEEHLELNDQSLALYYKEVLQGDRTLRNSIGGKMSFSSMKFNSGCRGFAAMDFMDSADYDCYSDETDVYESSEPFDGDYDPLDELGFDECEISEYGTLSGVNNSGFGISLSNHDDRMFETIEEKGMQRVLDNPTSSFRTTCNTASLDIIRNRLEQGLNITKSMVRTEELLNYCDYTLKNPETENEKIKITCEISDKPNSEKKLMFIGLKGNEYIPQKSNIVILLDVSSSMCHEEEHVQAAIMTIVSKLKDNDKLSLITYSSNDNTIIENLDFKKVDLDYVIEKVLQLYNYGYTYGSKGLDKAYTLISKNKIKDGINRVVLITDGDFNFGDCDIDSVKNLISKKREIGAYLSIIGTGSIDVNDHLMNTLAKNGNGNYTYVRGIENVRDNVHYKYNTLMNTLVTDVKTEVEFNPKFIKEYKLVGYENREISHSDFKNDNVISEPFGSGASAVALYELVLNDEILKDKEKLPQEYKYQKVELVDSDELCSVHVRYKELGCTESKEITEVVDARIIKDAIELSDNLIQAYVVYMIANKLRGNKAKIKDKELLSLIEKIEIKALLSNAKIRLLKNLINN